jgi:hypothetical protein
MRVRTSETEDEWEWEWELWVIYPARTGWLPLKAHAEIDWSCRENFGLSFASELGTLYGFCKPVPLHEAFHFSLVVHSKFQNPEHGDYPHSIIIIETAITSLLRQYQLK